MSYIFGGDTGISYEQLQQRRKMVDRLRLQNARTPKNVGEGIQAIARALVARGVDRQNVEADKKIQDSLNSAFEDILGGSFGNPYSESYASTSYGPSYTPSKPEPVEKQLGLDMGTEGNLPQPETADVGGVSYDMGRPAISQKERELLAKTLQAEAGGEGLDGMIAAGAVINNRLNSGQYGESLEDVIMAPGQFSAWNGVTGYANGQGAIDMANLSVGDTAYQAADAILSGKAKDPTGGALNYYNPAVANPDWGMRNGGEWTRIGNHVFGTAPGEGTKMAFRSQNRAAPSGNARPAKSSDFSYASMTPGQFNSGQMDRAAVSASPTLGMIGGVKGNGEVWQSLDGQGRAHASNPSYKDYSQLFREYRYNRPDESWVPVGERNGRTVYAAPDYARDEQGNYLNVSAADAARMAQERGSLVPTRDEVKNLYGQAKQVNMPTSADFGRRGGEGTAQEYTAAIRQRTQGLAPGTPIVHGKEFFAQGQQQPTRQPVRTAQNGSFDPSIAKIAALVSHPALPEGQKMVLDALLKQKIEQSQPQRPSYQFIKGVGMVDMNNPPPELMAGQYDVADMDQTEYGLTPQYITDQDGNLKMIQLGKDGSVNEVELPEGAAIQKGVEKLDLGTHYQWHNTITGEPIGQPIPKNLAGAEAEKARGKKQGEAEAQANLDLGGAEREAERLTALIDSVIEDPALEGITGKIQGQEAYPDVFYSQEGVDLLAKVKQLQGSAFMEAYKGLKGGGQITEVEGKKAEQAQARLNRAQSTQAYIAALREMQQLVQDTLNSTREKAGQPVQSRSPSPSPDIPQSAPDFLNDQDKGLWDYYTDEEKAMILKAY